MSLGLSAISTAAVAGRGGAHPPGALVVVTVPLRAYVNIPFSGEASYQFVLTTVVVGAVGGSVLARMEPQTTVLGEVQQAAFVAATATVTATVAGRGANAGSVAGSLVAACAAHGVAAVVARAAPVLEYQALVTGGMLPSATVGAVVRTAGSLVARHVAPGRVTSGVIPAAIVVAYHGRAAAISARTPLSAIVQTRHGRVGGVVGKTAIRGSAFAWRGNAAGSVAALPLSALVAASVTPSSVGHVGAALMPGVRVTGQTPVEECCT